MFSFIGGILFLILGYFTYGVLIERIFQPNKNTQTPAYLNADGFDNIPMNKKRNALIQLLNIAGTGPVFGPILGGLFGPVAFLLIPIVNILGGAVHDYSIGMASIRNQGSSAPALASHLISPATKHIFHFFSMLLLLLVGTVFVTTPAMLIDSTFSGGDSKWVYWVSVAVIFMYYIIATILPIDKIIGKIYPFFSVFLFGSAFFIGISMVLSGDPIPNIRLENIHPKHLPLFPMFFMTVTCGLLSGFHSSQSPLIARTMKNEEHGRFIFYGMMVAEGIIAMIWAAAAMALFGGNEGLAEALETGGPAYIVQQTSIMKLGVFAGSLAVLGVIFLPVSSGDTAFRSLRLIIAEYLNLPQNKVRNRYVIVIPVFAVALLLLFIDFNLLWRYFSWANQTLAGIALYTGAAYVYHRHYGARLFWTHLLILAPGIFILYASLTYILNAQIGFNLSWQISYIVGVFLILWLTFLYYFALQRRHREGIVADN